MQTVKRNILLNPGPGTTTDTVKYAQVVPDICPREHEFTDIMAQLRRQLVEIVHGDPGTYTSVLFCGSGTINIDIAVNSLLPADRKILVVVNGVYSERAAKICRCYHLPCIELKLPRNRPADPEAVSAALAEHPDVAVVYAVHHETATGLLNPVRELGATAHAHGAIFITDTTSTYGMIPLDIERDNIDVLMSSAQKGLMSMTGLSFIVADEALIRRSGAYPVRSYYCNLFRQYDFFERTGQMEFTPPVQVVYATRTAVAEYLAEGERDKFARHRRVYERLAAGVARLGFKPVIRPEWQSGLVLCLQYPSDPNWDFDAVHDACYARGFTIYPSAGDTFRLCAFGAIDVDDIDRFLSVFEGVLRDQNVHVPAGIV